MLADLIGGLAEVSSSPNESVLEIAEDSVRNLARSQHLWHVSRHDLSRSQQYMSSLREQRHKMRRPPELSPMMDPGSAFKCCIQVTSLGMHSQALPTTSN